MGMIAVSKIVRIKTCYFNLKKRVAYNSLDEIHVCLCDFNG